MKNLFTPYKLKGLELKNRIVFPPMCQYSVEKKDGIATDWHFVHYVSRAVGGTGLIIIEMTDVEPDGRISDYDLGLWSDDHIEPLRRIVDECHKYGAKVAVQIAHAGRKAQDAEVPVAPSPIAFDENSKTPRELTTGEVKGIKINNKFSIKYSSLYTGPGAGEALGNNKENGYLTHYIPIVYCSGDILKINYIFKFKIIIFVFILNRALSNFVKIVFFEITIRSI